MRADHEEEQSEIIPRQAAWTWVWGVLTYLMLATGLAASLIDARLPPAMKAAAAVGSCFWAAWYWVFAKRDERWRRRRWAQGIAFLFSVALMAALSWVHVAFTLLLFAYLGISFGALPVRWAIPVVVTASLGLALRFMNVDGMLSTLSDLLILAGFMTMALVASLLGLFVSSIVRQNADRRKMIEQLGAARNELAEAEREAGALEERQRLAGEIHDTIAQGLAGIVLQLQTAETELTTDAPVARKRINTAIVIARECLSEARRTLWALRPDLLQDEPFHRAVERVVRNWAERSGVTAQSHLTGLTCALSSDVEHTLIRCLQEALANIQKHAQARSVTVTLSYLGDEIFLDIQDDGRGFDISKSAPGFGLQGMKERVAATGGRLNIESTAGEGTTVVVQIPLVSSAGSEGKT
ncbi:MAG: sensor histidine kinase [Spirochaetales bacterium]|nr:sensor histidine kinase [Spirochaetales bacterium]